MDAFERRTGEHASLAGPAGIHHLLAQALVPRPPILVRQWDAGAHLGDVGRGMIPSESKNTPRAAAQAPPISVLPEPETPITTSTRAGPEVVGFDRMTMPVVDGLDEERRRVHCRAIRESQNRRVSVRRRGRLGPRPGSEGPDRGARARKRGVVFGLATGSTPVPLYRELVRLHREEGLSFARVTTFNLDEYHGLGPDHRESYGRFMREQLFDHIDIPRANIHIPDGTAPLDTVFAMPGLRAAIDAAGGIDLQILGIGRTGHIGFNEPGSTRDSRTRLIALDRVTRLTPPPTFWARPTSRALPSPWAWAPSSTRGASCSWPGARTRPTSCATPSKAR